MKTLEISHPKMEDRELIIRHKHPKTFGRKAVKLSDSQNDLLENFLPRFQINTGKSQLDIGGHFTQNGPLHLEVGFGMGEYAIEMAERHPEHRIIGCEVFLNGIASLLKGIKQRNINNIRIINGDARIALKEFFPAGIFDYIHINHPDPWPKKRHHKRRLIQTETVELLARALKPGGEVWLSTDIEDYREWMKECFDPSEKFEAVHVEGRFLEAHSETRLKTRFEEKGLRQGRPAGFLCYRKKSKEPQHKKESL